MNRNVINKHRNSPFGLTSEFFKQGLSDEAAKGVLVITNRPGYEGLYILNNDGEVKAVAQASNNTLPKDIIDRINEIVNNALREGIMETIDSKIDDKIDNYNSIVIESGDTIIANLQEYTNTKTNILAETIAEIRESMGNLGSSDHVFISQTAYNALLAGEKIKIDSNGNRLYPGDVGYDEAKFITFRNDVYYCIPESDIPTPEPGEETEIIVSGTSMVFNFITDENDEHAILTNNNIVGTAFYF